MQQTCLKKYNAIHSQAEPEQYKMQLLQLYITQYIHRSEPVPSTSTVRKQTAHGVALIIHNDDVSFSWHLSRSHTHTAYSAACDGRVQHMRTGTRAMGLSIQPPLRDSFNSVLVCCRTILATCTTHLHCLSIQQRATTIRITSECQQDLSLHSCEMS